MEKDLVPKAEKNQVIVFANLCIMTACGRQNFELLKSMSRIKEEIFREWVN